MERPTRRSISSGNGSSDFPLEKNQYTSPISGSSGILPPSRTKRGSRRRRRKTFKSTSWSKSNWKLLATFLVTPLIITLVLVLYFLKRIETPEPLLSPEQVEEVQQAQELHHLHVLKEIQREHEQQEHHLQQPHYGHGRKKGHDAKQYGHDKLNVKPRKKHGKRKKNKNLRGNTVTNNELNNTHAHVIPNVLIFTHSVNLLNTTNFEDEEDLVLKHNVQNTIRLHPNATVRFLTNDDCITSINNIMGHDSPLVQYFKDEQVGMYKADICRGAALYETGGLYFDVDLHARMSLWTVVHPTTQFVVPQVHLASKHRGSYFQAFIGATPQHAILYRYLELFVEYYQGKLRNLENKPLGVVLLKMAHDDVIVKNKNDHDAIELWQEVLYKREWFPHVPPPNYGTRRACHFVVVANKKPPFVVPFYSRVKGSRMCGGKDSVQQNKK